jgi:hypothetical protein
MCFQSIQLAGDKSSPDAMDRRIITGDDQGTKYLESHGIHMPPIDTD